MKKKVFIMTVSRNFMAGHPRVGEPTNFIEQIESGQKIHTIRGSKFWKKVADQVNAGLAVIQLRYWSGKPYGSKQEFIKEFDKVGIQPIKIKRKGACIDISIDGKAVEFEAMRQLSSNDGLSPG